MVHFVAIFLLLSMLISCKFSPSSGLREVGANPPEQSGQDPGLQNFIGCMQRENQLVANFDPGKIAGCSEETTASKDSGGNETFPDISITAATPALELLRKWKSGQGPQKGDLIKVSSAVLKEIYSNSADSPAIIDTQYFEGDLDSNYILIKCIQPRRPTLQAKIGAPVTTGGVVTFTNVSENIGDTKMYFLKVEAKECITR